MDEQLLGKIYSFNRGNRYMLESGNISDRANYYGFYWEKTLYSTDWARFFDFSNQFIYTYNQINKGYGMSLRCVAK